MNRHCLAATAGGHAGIEAGLPRPAIRALLERIGYEGFITVEQERDPLNAGGSLADVEASRDYLMGVGF